MTCKYATVLSTVIFHHVSSREDSHVGRYTVRSARHNDIYSSVDVAGVAYSQLGPLRHPAMTSTDHRASLLYRPVDRDKVIVRSNSDTAAFFWGDPRDIFSYTVMLSSEIFVNKNRTRNAQ